MTYCLQLSVLAVFLGVAVVADDAVVDHDFHAPGTVAELRPLPTLPPARQGHYAALRHFAQGRHAQAKHRLAEAYEAYRLALRHDPNAAPVLRALVPLCLDLQRPAEALEYCRRALTIDPKDGDLWQIFGEQLEARGQLDEALKAYTKAVQLPQAKDKPARYVELLYAKAALHEQLRQDQAAAVAYQAVAELLLKPERLADDPDDLDPEKLKGEAARAYEKLARVQLRRGKHLDAITAFQKAHELAPQGQRLDYWLAEVYQAARQPRVALEYLERYLATQPAGTEPFARWIDLMQEVGRGDQVLPRLEKALATDRDNTALKLLLAQQYLQTGKLEPAEKLLLTAYQEAPSEDTYYGLAMFHAAVGRWQALLRRFDRVSTDPNQVAAARLQLEVMAKEPRLLMGMLHAAARGTTQGQALGLATRRVLGVLARQAHQWEAAEALARSCLGDDPRPADAYLELARVLAEARRYDALVQVCREALAHPALQDTAVSRVFSLELARALALAGRGRESIDLANQNVRQALPGTEDQRTARLFLVEVCFHANQLPLAQAEAEMLLPDVRGTTHDRAARAWLARIAAARREFALAEGHWRQIVEHDPNDAEAYRELAVLLTEEGRNLDEAESLARRALDLERADRARRRAGSLVPAVSAANAPAVFLDTLAWVLFKRGHLQQARQLLELAVRQPDGDRAVIWSHLGDAAAAVQDFQRAQAAWERALVLHRAQPTMVGSIDPRAELTAKLRKLELIRTGGTALPREP